MLPFASDYLIEAPGQTAFYLIAFVVPLTLSLPICVRAGQKLGAWLAWRLGNAIEASRSVRSGWPPPALGRDGLPTAFTLLKHQTPPR